MTQTFDETKHPRDPSGQFAAKPASETDLDLGSAHGAAGDPTALRQAGLEALSRWDQNDAGARSQTSMRGLRRMMEDALTSDREENQRAGYLMAGAVRREGVGLTDGDAHAVMRGIAPHLTDEEVSASADELDESLTRSAQLYAGDRPGSQPDDERTIAAYRARNGAQAVPSGDAHEAATAYHERAEREAERAVACSRERANPRVTVPAAPLPDDPDFQEYKAGWDDPDVRARSAERIAVADLASEALWEGRSLDTTSEDVDPATLTPESLSRTSAAQDVASVLVQRGRHPDEARDYATRITHAQTMATYYSEGDPAEVMDAADTASVRARHTIVGVSQRDVTDWVDVAPAEDPAEPQYWAAANQEYWRQEATETTREALGHPHYYAPRI